MARAKGVSLAFMAVLSCCILQGAGGVTIEFRNECQFPVWPYGTEIHEMAELNTGQSWTVPLTAGSTGGRFWARTGCSLGSTCTTGDCEDVLNGVLTCTPPVTMVEYSLNEAGNVHFYDISVIGGFNIPISFIPSNSKCEAIACSSDITANCPAELKKPGSCVSACTVYNTSQYCCTGDYGGHNCHPTNYSRFFKTQCPQAHTYPLDNATATFNCSTASNYTVVFCGAATSSPSGAGRVTIEFLNECEFPVWPAGTKPVDEGPQLEKGESWTVPLNAGSRAGRIWGRTGCEVRGGVLHCTTGQCESVNCDGITPPATLVDYSFQGYSNLNHYDISLIGGFNIPISLIPSNSKCQPIACSSSNITATCPAELRVRDACMSACTIFNTSDQYCCTGDYIADNCRPSNYSRFFKAQCPQAYTYPTDDNNTSFTCSAGSNYRVVFCGASFPSPAASVAAHSTSGIESH